MNEQIITLYNSILQGKRDFSSLSANEKRELFAYLCRELEQGHDISADIMNRCASAVDTPHIPPARRIIQNTYKRLAGSKPRRNFFGSRHIMRRLLAAAVAVFTFVVFTFVPASAFGIDFVEHIKTMFAEESKGDNSNGIFFEGGAKMKAYKSIGELFQSELPGYLYPTEFPDGSEPFLVIAPGDENGMIFTLKIKTESSEGWIITAKEGSRGYLPLGYKYTAKAEFGDIEFVYTLSRNNKGITGYNVYTRYKGVIYTFLLRTGDWNDVSVILDSLSISS